MLRILRISQSRRALYVVISILLVSANLESLVLGTYLNGSDIVVGVVSTGEFSGTGLETDWGPTFHTYLTETVGTFLNPPRNFSIAMMTIPMTFKMVEEKAIDFIFTTPSVFSCLETENAGIFTILLHTIL
jgi:hypothetical protein